VNFAQHTFNILPVWRNKRTTDILPPNNFVINSLKFGHQQDERSSYFSLLNIVDAEQKGTNYPNGLHWVFTFLLWPEDLYFW